MTDLSEETSIKLNMSLDELIGSAPQKSQASKKEAPQPQQNRKKRSLGGSGNKQSTPSGGQNNRTDKNQMPPQNFPQRGGLHPPPPPPSPLRAGMVPAAPHVDAGRLLTNEDLYVPPLKRPYGSGMILQKAVPPPDSGRLSLTQMNGLPAYNGMPPPLHHEDGDGMRRVAPEVSGSVTLRPQPYPPAKASRVSNPPPQRARINKSLPPPASTGVGGGVPAAYTTPKHVEGLDRSIPGGQVNSSMIIPPPSGLPLSNKDEFPPYMDRGAVSLYVPSSGGAPGSLFGPPSLSNKGGGVSAAGRPFTGVHPPPLPAVEDTRRLPPAMHSAYSLGGVGGSITPTSMPPSAMPPPSSAPPSSMPPSSVPPHSFTSSVPSLIGGPAGMMYTSHHPPSGLNPRHIGGSTRLSGTATGDYPPGNPPIILASAAGVGGGRLGGPGNGPPGDSSRGVVYGMGGPQHHLPLPYGSRGGEVYPDSHGPPPTPPTVGGGGRSHPHFAHGCMAGPPPPHALSSDFHLPTAASSMANYHLSATSGSTNAAAMGREGMGDATPLPPHPVEEVITTSSGRLLHMKGASALSASHLPPKEGSSSEHSVLGGGGGMLRQRWPSLGPPPQHPPLMPPHQTPPPARAATGVGVGIDSTPWKPAGGRSAQYNPPPSVHSSGGQGAGDAAAAWKRGPHATPQSSAGPPVSGKAGKLVPPPASSAGAVPSGTPHLIGAPPPAGGGVGGGSLKVSGNSATSGGMGMYSMEGSERSAIPPPISAGSTQPPFSYDESTSSTRHPPAIGSRDSERFTGSSAFQRAAGGDGTASPSIRGRSSAGNPHLHPGVHTPPMGGSAAHPVAFGGGPGNPPARAPRGGVPATSSGGGEQHYFLPPPQGGTTLPPNSSSSTLARGESAVVGGASRGHYQHHQQHTAYHASAPSTLQHHHSSLPGGQSSSYHNPPPRVTGGGGGANGVYPPTGGSHSSSSHKYLSDYSNNGPHTGGGGFISANPPAYGSSHHLHPGPPVGMAATPPPSRGGIPAVPPPRGCVGGGSTRSSHMENGEGHQMMAPAAGGDFGVGEDYGGGGVCAELLPSHHYSGRPGIGMSTVGGVDPEGAKRRPPPVLVGEGMSWRGGTGVGGGRDTMDRSYPPPHGGEGMMHSGGPPRGYEADDAFGGDSHIRLHTSEYHRGMGGYQEGVGDHMSAASKGSDVRHFNDHRYGSSRGGVGGMIDSMSAEASGGDMPPAKRRGLIASSGGGGSSKSSGAMPPVGGMLNSIGYADSSGGGPPDFHGSYAPHTHLVNGEKRSRHYNSGSDQTPLGGNSRTSQGGNPLTTTTNMWWLHAPASLSTGKVTPQSKEAEMHAKERGYTVLVMNVPKNLTAVEIEEAFGCLGDVISTDIMLNSRGEHTGVVSIVFDTVQAAEDAVERYDGGDLNNNTIRVFMK